MVLHHSNDLLNDLDLDLHLDLNLNLDLDFWHIDHWPYDIHLYDSKSSQWFYTILMTLTLTSTLTLTLILTLTSILSLILLDFFRHYSIIWLYTISIVLYHHNDLDLWHSDHWPWPWPPSPTTTILQYTTLHTNTHHIANINVILNVNRRMKLRVIFIKRLHCPESAVIWRKTLSNNYAILYAILYIYNYKQSTYHVPPWRNGCESALQSEGSGFESRDRLKFWKSLLWHQWTQKR